MDAITSAPTTKSDLLEAVRSMFPSITFTPGEEFAYSHGSQTIFYPSSSVKMPVFAYSLLHEVGHSEELHTNFRNDVELINLERDAWEYGVKIGHKIGITIDPGHIESCMDTYRDWLYARSVCPHCHQCGLQTALTTYSCAFCLNTWSVSESRLCRVSRRSAAKK